MAKRMPFRFHKSFPLLGRFIQGTVSKKGVSLNMRMGPLSKSWGTGRRRSTTLDMPGTSGIFWRSQRRASSEEAAQDSRQFWLFASLMIWFFSALVLTGRMLLADSYSTAGLVIILLGQLIALTLARSLLNTRRISSLLIMIGLIVIGWLLFDTLVV